ncbi:hypothetical protein D3Z39_12375 [Anaerotruncus colihominis]|jgi:hypothetical protein|uniref:Uncharacterized protein n=1 Tax=Anaerotruncus colihominis TaxID=169435 RepID=A0A845RJC1_9FIRM|nr:hypothetical protein [Anaerotruncus colihominis]
MPGCAAEFLFRGALFFMRTVRGALLSVRREKRRKLLEYRGMGRSIPAAFLDLANKSACNLGEGQV